MSKVTRKIALFALSLLFAICLAFGIGGEVKSRLMAKAEGETTVNLTFSALGLNGGENNDATIVNGRYLTAVRFTTGVLSGSTNHDTAVYDYANMIENSTFSGEGDFGFAPGATKWAAGYKNDAVFNFIYFWTANAPVAGNTLRVKAGAHFTIAGTMVDGVACNDKYVLFQDLNFKFNGAAWEVYTPVEEVETVKVTLTSINSSWNNNSETLANGFYYTVLHLNGLLTSGYLGQNDDWSDALAKATINGGTSYFNFSAASYIAGPNKECDFIIIYSAQAPTEGDVFLLPAGTTFDVGGDDTNLYELSADICLKFSNGAWEVYTPVEEVETVKVTFTHINSSWNNNSETYNNGMYYTVLHLNGLLTSGYLGQDDDWSDALAKATINGGASYFNFSAASYIAGPNVACDFIIIYSAQAPTEGDVFLLPAGTTFDVGGDDTNLYELAEDIRLQFKDGAWAIQENETPTPPVEPDPDEPVLVTISGVNGTANNYELAGYIASFVQIKGVGAGATDGDFSDLASKVTLNGQPLDAENVSFMCGQWFGWADGIVLRFLTLPAENSILVFPAGATFTVGGEDTNVYKLAEDIELKLKNGKWSVPMPTAEFIGVNEWNNNIFTVSGSRLTLLDFDVAQLGNVVNANKNLVAMAGVSINGVKLTEIDGASITYMHGDNHMGIELPAAAIYPTEEYPITILKVEEGTVFENYELPEITLSLIGGTWLVDEYEGMPSVDNYVTISDIMGEDRVELGAEGMITAANGFEGDVHLKFVYYSNEAIVNYVPYGGLVVYLNSTNLWDGWRIFFVGNKVFVYDATMGGTGVEHVLIGEADFGISNGMEMQMEISVTQENGKYSIVIGGSCAKILELHDITPIGEYIGGGLNIYSPTRSCKVKDYKYGDVFDPVLTVYSKQEIVLNEGDEVPTMDAKAMDGMTEIIPTYVWDEGAVTDGKMNAGVWNCVITATDANGNSATEIVRVTVKGELTFKVSFDGKNETQYAYGAKIEKPADPTKAATVQYQYTFDGWYFGEEKWDFEHDIVTENVTLVAKFIQSDVYYKVTVSVSGETQVVYVTYGAQLDLSVFDKAGYTKTVKENGKTVTSLIVTEDTKISVSYQEATEAEEEGGCGSLVGVSFVLAAIGALGGCMMIRKRRDDDEE